MAAADDGLPPVCGICGADVCDCMLEQLVRDHDTLGSLRGATMPPTSPSSHDHNYDHDHDCDYGFDHDNAHAYHHDDAVRIDQTLFLELTVCFTIQCQCQVIIENLVCLLLDGSL